MGADLYCLHRSRWWQTAEGPRLDSGAFVAGLEYAAEVDATVLGKPSPQYFGAALEALDADPELAWMVGDDIEEDIAGAQRERHADGARPDGQVPAGRRSSARVSPGRDRLLDRAAAGVAGDGTLSAASLRLGVDLIEIDADPARARPPPAASASAASPRRSAPTATRSRTRPQHYAGALRRQGGGRQGARLRRPLHVEGDRDRRPAEAGRAALGPHGGLRRSGSARAGSSCR